MEKQYQAVFLKYRTQTIGRTSVQTESEVDFVVVAGEDEQSVVQSLTVHKNGLILLTNSETAEFWSNRKPIFSQNDDQTVITFESK